MVMTTMTLLFIRKNNDHIDNDDNDDHGIDVDDGDDVEEGPQLMHHQPEKDL